MYVEPLSLYREYVQNAADAIDAAQRDGLLSCGEGRIEIEIDRVSRSVRIRDNGIGVPSAEFVQRLCSVGASAKRGTAARGFRGVGRLAGLGYCQSLIFRAQAAGEAAISQITWDCRRLKSHLRQQDRVVSLSTLLNEIVNVEQIAVGDASPHFFEVELRGLVRLRTDALVSPSAVAEYLSEVGPVPFHPDFELGKSISSALQDKEGISEVAVFVAGVDGQLFRPHRDTLPIGSIGQKSLQFSDVEFVSIPSVEGDEAGFAWILHHQYEGALPSGLGLKGLRLRSGNIQTGGHSLLEGLFPEARFNSWAVGEVHVTDQRVVPNARRDGFEQNAHYSNLQNHVGPSARAIAKKCRTSSVRRNLIRDFWISRDSVTENISILAQGSLANLAREGIALRAEQLLLQMQKLANKEVLIDDDPALLKGHVEGLRLELAHAMGETEAAASPLSRLPADKQAMYHHLFELVYDCSVNRAAAKSLIDRILLRMGQTD
jgi:molecular chaperone HtpG